MSAAMSVIDPMERCRRGAHVSLSDRGRQPHSAQGVPTVGRSGVSGWPQRGHDRTAGRRPMMRRAATAPSSSVTIHPSTASPRFTRGTVAGRRGPSRPASQHATATPTEDGPGGLRRTAGQLRMARPGHRRLHQDGGRVASARPTRVAVGRGARVSPNCRRHGSMEPNRLPSAPAPRPPKVVGRHRHQARSGDTT